MPLVNWRDVIGFEGKYQVSDSGLVRSLSRTFSRRDGKPLFIKGKILRGHRDTKGYLQVELKDNGIQRPSITIWS